jgi:hypothetical protein
MVLNEMMKFRLFFSSINGLELNLSFFIFRGMAQNRIQSVSRSTKQAECRPNESKFLSVPQNIFSQKMATLNVQFLLRLYKTQVFFTIERAWLSVIKRRVVGTVPISGKIKYVHEFEQQVA